MGTIFAFFQSSGISPDRHEFSKMENQKPRISDLLLNALDNLPQENFERFKDKLAHSDFEGKDNIPRGWLQNANRIHTKNLLMEFYGEDAAVDVTIDVFTQINLRDSAAKLGEEREKAYRVKYREHIKNKYSTIKDMNARLGENVKLNSRYTKLIIINEHRHEMQREHEIMALGRRHAEIMAKHASPITIRDLFESDGNGQSPPIVVLQGAAGIGKTLTAKKIMLDWANEELYQSRFDYVFYINCREISFNRKQRSIEDLILKNCPDNNAPTKEILMNPEKLLFIIDGFDELRFSFNEPTSNPCSDPCEKQPVEIILSSLFRKKVLHKSYLIITTRPIALQKLGQFLKDERYAEILGFSENERKEYFYKFFRNEEQARKAFNFVKDNEMLFTMCFVPIVCWIICTVLKQQMEAGEDLARTSNTITGVYMLYLFSLIEGHSSNSKQQVQGNLKGLCSLAADGLWRKNILFEEEVVKKHGLDKPDSLFLNENMFQKGIVCELVYSFIHLSFQEFFAALFYVLEKEETVTNSETATQPVEKLFEKCGKSKNYLMLTVRFLFGLLNKKRMEEMEKNLSCKFSPKIKNNLLMWVKEKPFSSLFNCDKLSSDKETTIFYLDYFYCLYEIQEIEFVQSAMNHFTQLKLTHHTFTKMDQIVLQFCIKNCCKLESVCLEYCTFLTENLNEDSPGPCEWPHRAQHQDEPHHLPIYLLWQALKASNCNLKKLSLEWCDLTAADCGYLAAVLSTNQSLTELKLSGNKLGDSRVQLLCEGLKHPNCKLQRLRLYMCRLTDAGCGDLAAVLSTSQSLRELELGANRLGVSGVRLLCEGLKHPNCKLQILRFFGGRLPGACCEDLASVLTANESLTELDVAGNNLEDAGVQLLCKGLTHPNCKLQSLRLWSCRLTDAGCGDLAAVLRTNQSLTVLNLGGNKLGDAGVRQLCEGLKQNCKLQSLSLWKCGVTASGSGDLAAVLRTSQSLTELDLHGNYSLGDAGVRLLCEGLKHPNCKLQRLGLEYCDVTAAACGDLAAVLRTSQSLTKLDLQHNELGDTGVWLLCEGLNHPNCKLQKLNLDQRYFSEEMWAELDAVKDTKPDLVIETQYSW
ncbi:NACHT, LRR and PYD domains-containing protein 3-like isoform X2 [Dermochelys coriacea]|uniref:NACHT, LRR and PYD domains-containing protein 3-like isoform X2 n=1 Tax=Dermochelys coriacea TaxID=27794 RepID=UPI001CAA2A53|nr:NACHT, LRR and PYD domains-containing protein 3-like isoform X2 [Dermochelys coriacea]